MTKPSSSPIAEDSAFIARRSISALALAGQAVGIREVEHGIWLVSCLQYDLGYIDLEEKTLQPLQNPSGQKSYLCLRNNLLPMCPVRTMGLLVGARGFEP